MTRRLFFIPLLSLGLSCAGLVKTGPLRMELVLDQDGVVAGQDCWIGWRIIREKGWHTYWKHPGDVGVPPTLQWEMPTGFSAGELLYAPPVKVKMGSIRANGNYGETLFLTKLGIPDGLIIGETYNLKAKASWLSCSQQCLPGFADLSLDVKVVGTSTPNPIWRQRFEEFRKNIPRTIAPEWQVTAVEDNNMIHLSFVHKNLGKMEKSRPIFFSADRLTRSNGSQFMSTDRNSITLRMEKSEWAKEGLNILSGLVYREKGWGDGFNGAYRRIRIPLTNG